TSNSALESASTMSFTHSPYRPAGRAVAGPPRAPAVLTGRSSARTQTAASRAATSRACAAASAERRVPMRRTSDDAPDHLGQVLADPGQERHLDAREPPRPRVAEAADAVDDVREL